jgi:hypothetical protein
MEVHHHPQVERKNLKEYFLEFLMIFLAVTMGFFAESIREHFTEETNTKEYLETNRDELLGQQKLFTAYKKNYQNKVIICDSIKLIFLNGEENKKLDILRRLLIPGLRLVEIPFNTSSYDQIVNSGALRYINNINLRDSMAAYKGQIEAVKDYNSHFTQTKMNNSYALSKLEDLHDIISSDTSQSYDLSQHLPEIKPFAPLSQQERNSIVFFYETFIVQAQSNLRRIRIMYASNQNLLNIVNDQLEK